MIPSANCASFIKGFETCRLEAFKPTPNDVWTCGWGATGPDVGPHTVWTQTQADQRFVEDLNRFALSVSSAITHVTAQQQFDAMTSLSYNIGMAGFHGSTVLRDHNAGNFAGAKVAFSMWDKQADIVLGGLVKRRAAEAAMYGSATTP